MVAFKVAEVAEQFPEVGNMILAFEEKEKNTPQIPAAPPKAAPVPENPYTAPDALAQMEWLDEMDTDPRVAETMKMAHQVPASKKDEYLAAFAAQLTGTTQVHHSRKDLRNHFFNFSDFGTFFNSAMEFFKYVIFTLNISSYIVLYSFPVKPSLFSSISFSKPR